MSEREVNKVAEDDKKQEQPRAAQQPQTLEYRFVGSHAEVLANGRPMEPGEFVDLTEDELRDPFYEDLIHNGNLIGVEEGAEHQVSLAHRRVERRLNNEDGEES